MYGHKPLSKIYILCNNKVHWNQSFTLQSKENSEKIN